MLVSVVMPWGPRFLRWTFEMLSTPMAEECLMCLIMLVVSVLVAKVSVVSRGKSCLRLLVCLSVSLCFGR